MSKNEESEKDLKKEKEIPIFKTNKFMTITNILFLISLILVIVIGFYPIFEW